ncbi:coatomer, subunit beta' [Nematocida displodere]|uniref:Coatomer, subunit beta n=1 Tax=Nematocida displodere TaxID=1805483 RepID=A0A177EM09_9MICR|nr:coatomer, subunit beta' [Nematocida displodere]
MEKRNTGGFMEERNTGGFMEERISGRFEKARVKHLGVHKKSPLALAAVYNGDFELWNTATMTMIKSASIGEVPIRAGEFLEERESFVLGSDDGMVRVFCTDTFEIKEKVQAHKDFIRKIAVHPTLPYIATCSDDGSIKIWDYSKDLSPVRSLEGHTHFVMSAEFSPKDSKILISCSLDTTVRIWNIETGKSVAVLKGALTGLNAVAYIGEKYIVSGGDDGKVSVWDASTEALITSVPAHTGPVTSIATTAAGFLTAGEDGIVREWTKKRFRPETAVPARLQRLWCVGQTQSKDIVAGGDEGLCFIKKAQTTSLFSFKVQGEEARIIFTEDTTIKQVKTSNPQAQKSVTTLSYLPDRLEVSDSGRYLAVETDGTVYIYTILGFLLQLTVPGHSLIWTGPEDFLIVHGTDIVQYTEFEVDRKVVVSYPDQSRAPVKSIQKVSQTSPNTEPQVLVQTQSSASCIIDRQGRVLFALEEEAIGAHMHRDTCIAIYKDRVDVLTRTQTLNQYRCKVSSWCAKNSTVFIHGGGKVSYFVVPDAPSESAPIIPMAMDQLSSTGVVLGVTDRLWYIDNGKLGCFPIDWEFAAFQGSVVSGVLPKGIPPALSKDCVHFLVRMDRLEDALAVSLDQDEKFELLLKLGRLDEAVAISNSEAKYSRLCGLLVERGEILQALECAKKGSSIENEILLSSIVNDTTQLRSASEKAYRQGKLLIALAAAHRSDNTELCKTIFKDSPYEEVFNRAQGLGHSRDP